MNEVADIRRANLRRLVERDTLASVSRRAGKPDRQINDMIAGRKSFGEKVARAIERNLDPSRPAGWLDLPPTEDLSLSSNTQETALEVSFTSENVTRPPFTEPRRWPFSPELHDRIMRIGESDVAELESALEHQLGLVEARLSRDSTKSAKPRKRAS